EVFDRWQSAEGIDKVIQTFGQIDTRHKPVIVEDHYVVLVYKGDDNTFKVFYDIRELPSGFSKKNVSPITFVELLYLSVYESINRYPVLVTRYPVEGPNSSYPSFGSVKTTVQSEKRYVLDEDWVKREDLPVAYEFP